MTMVVSAITATDWSVRVDAYGRVVENIEDIAQCVGIILGTPKGSRPHEPLFGCDAWKYLDAPMGEALPHIVKEVAEAIELWEPRIHLVAVEPDLNGAGQGQLTLRLSWRLAGDDVIHATEVSL